MGEVGGMPPPLPLLVGVLLPPRWPQRTRQWSLQ
jgi:hypothetical protein